MPKWRYEARTTWASGDGGSAGDAERTAAVMRSGALLRPCQEVVQGRQPLHADARLAERARAEPADERSERAAQRPVAAGAGRAARSDEGGNDRGT